MKKMRRVITGIDKDGLSRFVSDEVLEAFSPPTLGTDIIQVYGADDPLIVPFDGIQEEGLNFFPKQPAAFRFIVFTYPPNSDKAERKTDEASHAETERLAPGIGEVISHGGGMHATSTVDLEYVLSGQLTLKMDSGEQTVLKAGDCLIQCGTLHSWVNESDEPATVLCIFVGANQDMSRFPKSE